MHKKSLKAAPVKSLNTLPAVLKMTLVGTLSLGMLTAAQAREVSHELASPEIAVNAEAKKESLKKKFSPPVGKNLQDASELPPTAYDKLVMQYLAFAINTNSFDNYLKLNITFAKILPVLGGKIRDVPADTLRLGQQIAEEAARMLVEMRGLSKKHPEIKYLEWKDLSAWLKRQLDAQESERKSTVRNDVKDPGYMAELYDLAGNKPAAAREFQILVNGPTSFAKRNELLRNAKSSIDMMTWAVLDDETGRELRDILIEKHNQGVPVRLMVDGQVNQRNGYNQTVKEIEKAGVPVIRWLHKSIPYVGQHRKMMIVDGTYMVAGGMNPGNTYSHKAVPEKDRWRDTDFYATGDFVDEGNQLFANLWNQQIQWHNLKFTPMETHRSELTGGSIPVTLVEHMPDLKKQTGSTIMLSILKAMRGAHSSIDIENAYVILFPELQNEITQAIKRGVKVRVLSNSDMSVDEPIISQPMMRSAKRLATLGAEVYQKTGSTLHSKYLVVDNQITIIGSYNLHPRSERVEGEVVFVVDDARTAQAFTDQFNKDTLPAVSRKSAAKDIIVKGGVALDATMRLFFDLL